MRSLKELFVIIILLVVTVSCNNKVNEDNKLKAFSEYFLKSKEGAINKWDYTTDTVKVWFDEKKGEPTLKIKDKKTSGKWKEWDEEMNSSTKYDSLWFDKSDKSIKGYFYENNDFYKLIGKSPTKTLQTYWLNNDNKIHEILIYWIPEKNTTTSDHLKPIVDWALKNDSVEISALYPNGNIIPSKQNALRWKKLLEKYKENQNTN